MKFVLFINLKILTKFWNFWYFYFHDQVKFHVQVSWAWIKIYNLGARCLKVSARMLMRTKKIFPYYITFRTRLQLRVRRIDALTRGASSFKIVLPPFWKGVYSKRKEKTPYCSKFFPFNPWIWSGSTLFAIQYVNLYRQSGPRNLIGWKFEKGVAS